MAIVTIPNEKELANNCPTINLAGQLWPIPVFAFKQNKIIVPIVIRLGKPGSLSDLNEKTMDDLGTAVFFALTRAHSTITIKEFEDWPIATADLIAALNVVAEQTGLLKPGEAQKSMEIMPPSTSTT